MNPAPAPFERIHFAPPSAVADLIDAAITGRPQDVDTFIGTGRLRLAERRLEAALHFVRGYLLLASTVGSAVRASDASPAVTPAGSDTPGAV